LYAESYLDGEASTIPTAVLIITFRPLMAICAIAAFVGCTRNSSTDAVSTSTADSVIIVYKATGDSVASAWKRMITDDDEKLFHIKRLLEEVTYTGNYDQVAVDSLMGKHQALVELRYDQRSMADSDLIDEYDVLTSELIHDVTSFAKNHPDYKKYPLMEELIMDIMEADNRVLLHRIKYDSYCRELNSLVKSQKGFLDAGGESNLDEMPLFTLSE